MRSSPGFKETKSPGNNVGTKSALRPLNVTPSGNHSYLEFQQDKRTCKLTCCESKCSFKNYGILGHVVCILSSIFKKKIATPCNTNSSKVRITQLFHRSKQKESAPSSFHNETFNVRALELKSCALDRNFERLEANLF